MVSAACDGLWKIWKSNCKRPTRLRLERRGIDEVSHLLLPPEGLGGEPELSEHRVQCARWKLAFPVLDGSLGVAVVKSAVTFLSMRFDKPARLLRFLCQPLNPIARTLPPSYIPPVSYKSVRYVW